MRRAWVAMQLAFAWRRSLAMEWRVAWRLGWAEAGVMLRGRR